jgi:ferritin-like metal-binding protein YciE
MTDTLQKLFEDTVKDLYNAEKQFLKAMPKMSKAARNPELKAAIDEHTMQTKGHVERLEEVAKLLEIKPTGKVCKAAQGLVEEAEEHLEEVSPGPVLDAALVVCAQKNEHYEICSYGTLIAWADELGLNQVTKILQATLAEEKAADVILTKVAEAKVNAQADATVPSKSKASVK